MATDTDPLAAGASQSDKCSNSPLAPTFFIAPGKSLAHANCLVHANCLAPIT